jgi:hypothetical protein
LKAIVTRLIFLLLLASHFSFAQENSPEDIQESGSKGWDRFEVSLGGFLSAYNSGITFRSQQLGLGLVIDIEDALGLETTVFALRGEVTYKIGKSKKNYITAGYFGVNRSANKNLEEEIDIGGIVYPIGTKVNSKFNLSIIRLKYGYSFYQDERVSISASFGLFIMPVTFVVQAPDLQDSNTNFTAPLPLIGLRTDFQITEKFYLKQNVEFLYLSTNLFNGGILDLGVYLEHKTLKNVAFGLGVNSNRLNISLKKPDSLIEFFGDIRMDYTGALLYAKYYF